jgi:hypothetical protein
MREVQQRHQRSVSATNVQHLTRQRFGQRAPSSRRVIHTSAPQPLKPALATFTDLLVQITIRSV